MLCIPIPLTPQGSRLLRPTRHMRRAERLAAPQRGRVSVMTAAWRSAVSRSNPDGVSSSRSRTSSKPGSGQVMRNSRLVRARSARASSRLAPRGAREPRLRRTLHPGSAGGARFCRRHCQSPARRVFQRGRRLPTMRPRQVWARRAILWRMGIAPSRCPSSPGSCAAAN
jgi:hypothetical protein